MPQTCSAFDRVGLGSPDLVVEQVGFRPKPDTTRPGPITDGGGWMVVTTLNKTRPQSTVRHYLNLYGCKLEQPNMEHRDIATLFIHQLIHRSLRKKIEFNRFSNVIQVEDEVRCGCRGDEIVGNAVKD